MSPDDVRIVSLGWQRAGTVRDHVASLFYDRLFETVPAARSDFHAEQMPLARRRLVNAIDGAMTHLNTGEPPARHHHGSNKPADLLFGAGDAESLAALLWVLHRVLGQGWTPAVEAAWRACAPRILAALRPRVPAG